MKRIFPFFAFAVFFPAIVLAAPPANLPPYVDAMQRIFDKWKQEGLLNDAVTVKLVLNPPHLTSGLLLVPGGATIEFDAMHPVFNAQFAIDVMKVYLKDGPVVAKTLGVPFPREVYIQPLVSDRQGSFVPEEPRVITDPRTGDIRIVPVIRISSADLALRREREAVLHEFTHTITECGTNGHICELLSHLIEQRMGIRPAFHVSFPSFAIDFAPNGFITENEKFNAELRAILGGVRVPAHEHAFGVLLGHALISRSGVPDYGEIGRIFDRLKVARQSNDPDTVAKALGFKGGSTELIRAVKKAFYDQLAVANSSYVKPFFDAAKASEMAYRAAHPAPATPSSGGVGLFPAFGAPSISSHAPDPLASPRAFSAPSDALSAPDPTIDFDIASDHASSYPSTSPIAPRIAPRSTPRGLPGPRPRRIPFVP